MAVKASEAAREYIWQKVKEKGVSRAREIVIDGKTWSRVRRVKAFGSLARVETGAGAWTLKRVGWFRTRITVRRADTDQNVALFTPSFTWCGTAGIVEFEGGRSFRWGPMKSFGREHAFLDSSQMPLLRYRGSVGKCRMTLETPTIFPELPLLAALGYYILQLHAEDSGSTGAAIAAAAAG
jgi:hypothetical protein